MDIRLDPAMNVIYYHCTYGRQPGGLSGETNSLPDRPIDSEALPIIITSATLLFVAPPEANKLYGPCAGLARISGCTRHHDSLPLWPFGLDQV